MQGLRGKATGTSESFCTAMARVSLNFDRLHVDKKVGYLTLLNVPRSVLFSTT